MKMNRRQWAAAAAGSTLAARAIAQNPPAAPETDFNRAARELNQRNAETLAKVEILFSTEPAFQFRA
jgi:hypothetical protein